MAAFPRLILSRTYASTKQLPAPLQGSLPACGSTLWPGGIRTRWMSNPNFKMCPSTFLLLNQPLLVASIHFAPSAGGFRSRSKSLIFRLAFCPEVAEATQSRSASDAALISSANLTSAGICSMCACAVARPVIQRRRRNHRRDPGYHSATPTISNRPRGNVKNRRFSQPCPEPTPQSDPKEIT